MAVRATHAAGGSDADAGGDFTDVFTVADDRSLVVVGDVEGKGRALALEAERCRRTLHDAGASGAWPHQMVGRLNRTPRTWGPDDERPSCAVSVLSIRACRGGFAGRVCNAGSPLPLVLRVGGRLTPLGGMALPAGYFADTTWTDWAFKLVPGDTMLVFTDGLTDARSRNRLFGEGPLEAAARAVVRRHAGDGPSIAQALVDEAQLFAEPSRPMDDIAVVVLPVG